MAQREIEVDADAHAVVAVTVALSQTLRQRSNVRDMVARLAAAVEGHGDARMNTEFHGPGAWLVVFDVDGADPHAAVAAVRSRIPDDVQVDTITQTGL